MLRRATSKIKEQTFRLLAFSERYTRTDMNYVAHGGFWLTLDLVVASIITFPVSIAFANLISPETYGTYRYVLSVYGMLTIFVWPGIGTAVIQSISRGFEGALKAGFRKQLRWGTLATLSGFIAAIYYYLKGNSTLAIALAITSAAVPIMESLALYIGFLSGKKLFKAQAYYDMASQFIVSLALIVTLFLTKNLFVILGVYFASNIASRLLFFYLTIKTFHPKPTVDPQMWRYGQKLTFSQVISNISSVVDRFLLFQFLGPVEVARFSVAMGLPLRMMGVLRIIGTLALPKFAVRLPHEVRRSLPRRLVVMSAGIVAMILVYIFVAPFIFKLLFKQYVDSVQISQVLALSTLAAITYPVAAFFSAQKRVKQLYMINIWTFAVQVSALITLIPLWGIWGAVAATLTSRVATITTALYYFWRERKIPPTGGILPETINTALGPKTEPDL